MSEPQPLGLLNLPKELRLMVFQHLTVKVTHRKWKANADANEGNADMMLVWTTLPGVQILATCHELRGDAGSILQPRLEAMRNATIRLVMSPNWLATIEYPSLVDCLEPMNFKRRFGIDTRGIVNSPQHASTRVPEAGSLLDEMGHEEKRVDVAIRSRVGSGTALQTLLVDLEERLWVHAVSGVETKGRTLLVRLRPAPRRAVEAEIYRTKRPLDLLADMNAIDCTQRPEVQFRRGDEIEQTQWERDWAEGERSADWLFEMSRRPYEI